MAAKYIGRWSNSGPPRTRELSPIVKKIWLSIHPINFGSHVRDRTSCASAPRGNQREISYFLDSVGAWDLILQIYDVINGKLSKKGSADQYHMTILRAQVLPHRGNVFFKFSDDKLLVFNRSQAQLQVDFFVMVRSLYIY